MEKKTTYTEEEVVEIIALLYAMNAYKKMTGKELFDDEDKMLLTHLRIFSGLSRDTLEQSAELMKVGQDRITEMISDVGIYCMIMS